MDSVYVVLGCIDYEGCTVLSAFTDRAAAEQYVADYKAIPDRWIDGDLHSKYDWYDVLEVPLDLCPFKWLELAGNIESNRIVHTS